MTAVELAAAIVFACRECTFRCVVACGDTQVAAARAAVRSGDAVIAFLIDVDLAGRVIAAHVEGRANTPESVRRTANALLDKGIGLACARAARWRMAS